MKGNVQKKSYSKHWHYTVLHYDIHVSWTWFYLCYGNKVRAQEDTLNSINPEQLSAHNKKQIKRFYYIWKVNFTQDIIFYILNYAS